MKSTGSHVIASTARESGRTRLVHFLLFLAVILGILLSTALLPAADVCTYFKEDFSGTSGNTWTSLYGRWYVQNGKLNVDTIEAGTMAHNKTDFSAADFFDLDVDVELVAASNNNAGFGFFPYNSGDVFFDVNGRTVSGVGAIVYPNLGIARLLAWDVVAQEWYQSGDLSLPGSLASIGVSCSTDAFTLRINGQNTAISFSGSFSYSFLVLDKLWLFAQESGTHVRFDNVCAGSLGGTGPPTPQQYLLTVKKSGKGTGVITSSPPGIDCGADCSETLDGGTTVTLTATPNPGFTFGGWTGGGCSGTGTCMLTIGADTTVTAEFTITATPPPGGGDGGGGGATGLSGDGTAKLSLMSNDNFLVPLGRLRLAYDTKVFKKDAKGDLYLALVLENGGLFFLDKTFGLSATPVPFSQNVELSDGETEVLDIELSDDFSRATMVLYGVLARSGKSPLVLSNWISNLTYVNLFFGDTSGDQFEIRSLHGNPQFVKLEFDGDRKIRKESWGYPGSQVFKFVNGSLQESPRELVPASAGESKNRLLNFDEILTRPTSKLEDLRRTFGDPERVLEGRDPGTRIWVFKEAGMTVRTRNGAIYSVEVY